jgi:hypothetical protein
MRSEHSSREVAGVPISSPPPAIRRRPERSSSAAGVERNKKRGGRDGREGNGKKCLVQPPAPP